MRRREFIAGLGGAAWPVVALAQQPAMPVIGFLSQSADDDRKLSNVPFFQALKEAGMSRVRTWRSNAAGRAIN
jgi:putative ABC transport system substrate-binding protein